jgi:DNA-binding CsgD family transcriptional regulator
MDLGRDTAEESVGYSIGEKAVEFKIRGALCCVVPADDTGEARPAGSATDAGDQSAVQVIGDCRIDGRRYLILCTVSEQESSPERDAAAVDLLTRRELQVALMACEGRVNKQIALRLRLSERTVSSYLRRIYAKLGGRTRAAMVACPMSNSGPQPPVDKPHGVVSEEGSRGA